MDRRAFLAGTGAVLLAAPLGADAQQPGRVYRIGALLGGSRGENVQPAEAFRHGLRDLGYVEGQNISIEWRFAEGRLDRFPQLAAELVRLKVDVIFSPGTAATQAAMKVTTTIPIVIATAGNPVGDRLVGNLARPGGNVTGLTMLAGPELGGKYLELLKEAVPKISRVAVLSNPANPSSAPYLAETKAAAQSLRVQFQMLEARDPDGIEKAFAGMTKERPGAMLVLIDSMFILQRARIVSLAAKQRLPTMFSWREDVVAGGLMSYSASGVDNFRRAATYVDKILKGAKPGDLPIERPSKFELVINLKTAKSLGLAISPSLLGRANEIIQ